VAGRGGEPEGRGRGGMGGRDGKGRGGAKERGNSYDKFYNVMITSL